MDVTDVKALIFDVFGTVVDWRSSIIQHGKQFGRVHGVEADWDAFADAWRAQYRPFMDKVRHGALPWTNLDGLHRHGTGGSACRLPYYRLQRSRQGGAQSGLA